jgi:molybdate transport system permease protein
VRRTVSSAAIDLQGKRERRAGLDVAVAFAPVALLFVAFMGIPLAAMFWRAFDSGELEKNITSDLVIHAMRLSAVTSTVSLALAVFFGTPVAYLLARREFPGKTLVDLLVDLPIVLPPTVAGVALLVAFGRRGVLGEHLDATGIELAFTTTAVVLAQLFVSAPYYIRTVKAGFESVSPDYEGVASTLGASSWRIFRRIVLPLSWPSVVAGAILCWARGLSELGATLIFAGNFENRTQTMPLAIIGVFDAGRSIDVAIALGVILVLAAAVLLLLLRLVARSATRGVI